MIYYYVIVSKIYINGKFCVLYHLVSFCNLSKYFDYYKKNSTHVVINIFHYGGRSNEYKYFLNKKFA